MSCDGSTTGTVTFSAFLSEGNWDYLNLFSDARLVTNSIGPAANNGGVDNSGDLGRFAGTQDPATVAGVAVVQYISDWSYIEPGSGFTASLDCGGSAVSNVVSHSTRCDYSAGTFAVGAPVKTQDLPCHHHSKWHVVDIFAASQ